MPSLAAPAFPAPTASAALYRALLIDDEPPARQRLRTQLAPHADFTIVGEAGDADAALALIRQLQPDLVFLDINMPGASGLSVWREHGINPAPLLILVTAHREFALEAFDLHATDYLLKPFPPERFATALARVRRTLRAQGGPVPAPPAGPLPRFVLKRDGEFHFIDPDDIIRAEAQGDFVKVHTTTGSHLARHTLSALQADLPPDLFLRVHRSHLVHRGHITKVGVCHDGDYSITVTGGATVPVARAQTDSVRTLLR
jgi:two-component system LytT family response regulator